MLVAGAVVRAVPGEQLVHPVSAVAVPSALVHSPALHAECGLHTALSCSAALPVGALARKLPALHGALWVSVVASPAAYVYSPALHVE